MSDLKPCPNPWCASHKTSDPELIVAHAPIVCPSRASFEQRVCCPVCPISGPWADTEAEAIAVWNTRADNMIAGSYAVKLLESICAMQALRSGDATATHLALSVLCESARAYIGELNHE